MKIIYDIVLNFRKISDSCEFYEWNQNDFLTYIEEIPIMKISSEKFHEISRYSFQVSKSFLRKISHKCISVNQVSSYVVLFTDMCRVFAYSFNDDGIVFEKSSLMIEEEEAVIEECNDMNEDSLSYQLLDFCIKPSFFTRKERNLQKNLIQEIKNLYLKKKYDEIHYLYREITSIKRNREEEYQYLIDTVEKHFKTYYQSLYDIIQLAKQ